ncbi:hypothetical protein J4E89_008014 [Alternaria sp. Ai002NY15]|nr:hypothetical protein J4E89_008014 [Alternaria sp. Ai002NY15]
MSDLNEGDPARAVNEWQNLPAGQPNSNKVQRNMMKLVIARYSQVNPVYYSTILGGGQANAGQLESVIKKSVDTITSNWIRTSSWLQAFVEGETCWSDYQVIIDNLHRMSKLLKLILDGETAENRALRLTRREAYKKALRAHQEHVFLEVEAEIQTAEDAIEDLSTKHGVTQVKLQGARDELPFLRGDREGMRPTARPASLADSDETLKATPVCQSSAIKSLVRSSLNFPDNKALAYAEFKCADSILYPPEHANPPGSHIILWVQGAPSQKMRTRKWARESDVDEEEGRGMADFLRNVE